MIKAIFCDIDGTLLDNDGNISTTTKYWIKKLMDNNIQFIISSGRPYNALIPIFKQIGFSVPACCTLGSAFYDVNGNRLYHFVLDKEIIKTLYSYAHIYNHTGFSAFMGDELLINIPIIDYVRKNFGIDELPQEGRLAQWLYGVRYTDDLNDFIQKDIEKLEFHFGNDDDNRILYDKLKEVNNINYCCASYNNIEITCDKASKGEMVKHVCKLYGYNVDEVVTIGDGGNDLSMLKDFKYSFAMGNAPLDLKKQCHYITSDNDHNGVAEVIQRILNNEL